MIDRPVLVDSNVYIHLLRSGTDPSRYLADRYATVDLATCGMVQMEVLRGIREKKVLGRMADFFSILRWVESDQSCWEEAAEIAWGLSRRGLTVPSQDALIAACARRIGAAVYTFDKHFDEMPGVPVLRDPLP